MQGNAKILRRLNIVLKDELTAINQYFLHARICKNWGFEELNNKEYKASIKAMKVADQLIERILFLEGLPNLQSLGKIKLGKDVKQMFEGDMEIDLNARTNLLAAIDTAEEIQDYISRDLIQELLTTKEEHIDWLETQLNLIQQLDLENYLQSSLG